MKYSNPLLFDMKKFYTTITLIVCITVNSWVVLSSYNLIQTKFSGYTNYYSDTNPQIIGREAYKDKFAVITGEIPEEEPLPDKSQVLGQFDIAELPYKKNLIEMPLYPQDYYYGKHANATAGINEMNLMPILTPGSRVRVIGDGYVTMARGRGYVSPGSGFLFASGVCWSASALGMLMDETNKVFMMKYDIPLFTFAPGDRRPHPHWYKTYQFSNRGLGYSVSKTPFGGGTDYRFYLNPNLAGHPRFKDIKVKIVMVSQNDHPTAFQGQSIGGYVMTNIDF
jgi:hypothetical protein